MGKRGTAFAVLLLSSLYMGLVSAQQFYGFDAQDSQLQEYYREALELHKQYLGDKISFEELGKKMNMVLLGLSSN